MDTLESLRGAIDGTLTEPSDPGYEEARTVWNGMIDRHPVAVVRAGAVADIARTIEAARDLGLPLAIRGGGHNVAGNGTVDDGIVLDLGDLTDVVVDPDARRSACGGRCHARSCRSARPNRSASPCRSGSCPGRASRA